MPYSGLTQGLFIAQNASHAMAFAISMLGMIRQSQTPPQRRDLLYGRSPVLPLLFFTTRDGGYCFISAQDGMGARRFLGERAALHAADDLVAGAKNATNSTKWTDLNGPRPWRTSVESSGCFCRLGSRQSARKFVNRGIRGLPAGRRRGQRAIRELNGGRGRPIVALGYGVSGGPGARGAQFAHRWLAKKK